MNPNSSNLLGLELYSADFDKLLVAHLTKEISALHGKPCSLPRRKEPDNSRYPQPHVSSQILTPYYLKSNFRANSTLTFTLRSTKGLISLRF